MTDLPESMPSRPRPTFEELIARLEILQPALQSLVDQGIEVFSRVYPSAPRPPEARGKVWGVATINTHNGKPVNEELVLILDNGGSIVISKYNGSDHNAPDWRLNHNVPIEDNHTRSTEIMRFGPNSAATLPYDIEVSEYYKSQHVEFIGEPYVDKEPYINEFSATLTNL